MKRPILLAAAFFALASPHARAFHSGGVGHCGACHVMHDVDGVATATSELLGGTSASDICLNCHAKANGAVWGDNVLLPGPQHGGGSFVFLEEDNLNDGPLGADPAQWIPGRAAGHNVVAVGRGAAADPQFPVSPGGTYPSSALGCTSCHDPHGKGGHFRLLYGSDSEASRSNGHTFQFQTPAPDAEGTDVTAGPESPTNHTAYRSGISAWCGNCHGAYHSGGGASFEHPVNEVFDLTMVDTYNRYRGTGFYDGTGSDSYQPLAPYEAPESSTQHTGPTPSTARVMCLSCHRAHGSSGPASGRWDFKILTWQDEGTISGSWPIPNPYQSTAGPAQKRLCEKCHGASVPGPPPPGGDIIPVEPPPPTPASVPGGSTAPSRRRR